MTFMYSECGASCATRKAKWDLSDFTAAPKCWLFLNFLHRIAWVTRANKVISITSGQPQTSMYTSTLHMKNSLGFSWGWHCVAS